MTPQELHTLVFNFRAARAVMFAVQAGLFEELCVQDSTLDELVERLGLHRASTAILLATLVQLGVLYNHDNRFVVSAALKSTLRRDVDGSIANLLLLDANHWSNWSLTDNLFCTPPEASFAYDRQKNFAAAMKQGVGDMNNRLAQVLLAHSPRHVVDVGSGAGLLIEKLLKLNTNTKYTLIDFKETLEIAKRHLSEHVDADLSYISHDIVSKELDLSADCIVASRLLMGFDEVEAQTILANMCSGLAKGGVIVINEFDINTKVGALMSLDMLVNCGARVHPPEQISRWLEQFGFTVVSETPTTAFTRALCAKKDKP